MFKIAFFDYDGTLTDPKTREVPPSTLEAIRAAQRNGVLVYLATGRHPLVKNEGAALEIIGADGFVGLSGQIGCTADGTFFRKCPLDKSDVSEILRYAKSERLPCLVSELDRIYLNRVDDTVRECLGDVNIEPPQAESTEGVEKRDVYCLSPYVTGEHKERMRSLVNNSEFVMWSDSFFDVIPKDGGKDAGVLAALSYLGIAPDEAIAFGDAENDITMLELCGVGVAMHQSSEEVKRSANAVAPPHSQDGIARMMRKYGLI